MIERDGVTAFESARELLDDSELADVVLYEISGRRVGNAEKEQFALQVRTRFDYKEFEIRCKTSVMGKGGQYVADAGAIFKFKTEGEIEEPIARDFAEKVGVMTVYPYLRAAVSQTASSLGLDRPVLPLLRAGTIKLTADEPPDEIDNPETAE